MLSFLLSGSFLFRLAARRLFASLLKDAPRTRWPHASAERKTLQHPLPQHPRVAEGCVSDPRPNTLFYLSVPIPVRQANELREKRRSKIGSRIRVSAWCTTRSRNVAAEICRGLGSRIVNVL